MATVAGSITGRNVSIAQGSLTLVGPVDYAVYTAAPGVFAKVLLKRFFQTGASAFEIRHRSATSGQQTTYKTSFTSFNDGTTPTTFEMGPGDSLILRLNSAGSTGNFGLDAFALEYGN